MDRAYLDQAIADSRGALQLYQSEAAQGADPTLRSLTAADIDTLHNSLDAAIRLRTGVN